MKSPVPSSNPADPRKLVALFSGGLDSILAIRVMQEQGFEIEAFCVLVPYGVDRHDVAKVAGRLGVRLTAVPVGPEYWEMLPRPEYGYGKAANPCIDCRLHMVRKAAKFREMIGGLCGDLGGGHGTATHESETAPLGPGRVDVRLAGTIASPSFRKTASSDDSGAGGNRGSVEALRFCRSLGGRN